ncbi:MAG TPA: hypothetical protein VHH36_05905, partial [Candidatus Thermoplasmatota archaeon]|nr:hypothetical protein [Candidatus Thermoplasmatota archaeon]
HLAGSRDPEADLRVVQSAAEIASFGVEEARAAARIAREALDAGAFPGWADVLVAATAQTRGDLAVVARNPRHFGRARTY